MDKEGLEEIQQAINVMENGMYSLYHEPDAKRLDNLGRVADGLHALSNRLGNLLKKPTTQVLGEKNMTQPTSSELVSNLKIWHDTDRLCGEYKLPTQYGDYLVTACVPLAPIRKEVMKVIAQRHTEVSGQGGKSMVGGLWSDLIATGNKLAKKVGARQLVAKFDTILNSAAGMKGLDLAKLVIPGLGITIETAKAGAMLIDKARAGDKAAQVKLAKLAEQANEGNERAENVVKALSAINKEFADGATVEQLGSWIYDSKYRTVLQEAVEPNPFKVARHLYNQGV